MAFLRRGTIKFPHKGSTTVHLTRIDGTPIFVRLGDLSCWEEHRISNCITNITILYHGVNSTAVRETFDEVSAAINGKEVAP